MDDEIKDDVQETEIEDESVEETTEKPKEDLSLKNKQLFERLQKEIKKNKDLEERMAKSSAEKTDSPRVDPIEIAELSFAFEGLDSRERERLVKETKAQGLEINSKNLSDMRKNEDFAIWQSAYKEKVDKEKAPPPSTKQTGGSKKKFSELSPEEKTEYLQGLGALKKFPEPKIPQKN
jgi:hypothetical protein